MGRSTGTDAQSSQWKPEFACLTGRGSVGPLVPRRLWMTVAGVALVGVALMELGGPALPGMLLAWAPLFVLPDQLFRCHALDLSLSAAGIALRTPRSLRRLPWSEIAWVGVQEAPFAPRLSFSRWLATGGRSSRALRLEIGLTNGRKLQYWFLVDNFLEWNLWENLLTRLHTELLRRRLQEERHRIEKGEEIDFGLCRLSAKGLRVRHHLGWEFVPLDSWHTAEQRQKRSISLPPGMLRNPSVFRALLGGLTPLGENAFHSSRLGTIRAVVLSSEA